MPRAANPATASGERCAPSTTAGSVGYRASDFSAPLGCRRPRRTDGSARHNQMAALSRVADLSDALVQIVAQRVGEMERDLPGLRPGEPEAAD